MGQDKGSTWYIVLLIVWLAGLAACSFPSRKPATPAAGQNVALPTITAGVAIKIPGLTPTVIRLSPAAPTARLFPTITPNLVVEEPKLATALPPAGSFVAPQVDIAALEFDNQTAYNLKIQLQGQAEPVSLVPGASGERLLDPGQYEFTVLIQGEQRQVYADTVELDNHTRLVVALKEGTLAFDNQTSQALNISLSGSGVRFSVPPLTISQPKSLPPGEYRYEAVPSGGGALQLPMSGDVDVLFNQALTITIQAENLASGLVIDNQTQYEMVVTLEGVDKAMVVAPNRLSAEMELQPGVYRYTARSSEDNIAPFTGSLELEPGYSNTLTLSLGGDRAEITFINQTNCELTVAFQGPEELTITIPGGEQKTANIASGEYKYTVAACSAFSQYAESFSGIVSIEFTLE